MLGKLLKYDLKWVYKIVVIYYGLALVFAIIGRLLSFIDNSFIFDVISKKFPGVPVFVILPAARKTQNDVKISGTLEDVRKIIEEKAKTYDNFYVLVCGRKIQSERDLSSDGIHPHTEGMDFYAGMILDEIKNVLDK